MKAKPVDSQSVVGYGREFMCPGCGMPHVVPVIGPQAWGFNGDNDHPTFTPSILVHENARAIPPYPRCHSHVTDGRIQFLADCGHPLAGQTVDLPEIQ